MCWYVSYLYLIEGSLEVKLPTRWTDEKQRWSRRIETRRAEERRSEKRKSQKKEDAGARKGRKVAKHCVFPMICGSRGSKSRLAKAAGAEPAGQMRDEKVHAVVAQSTFRSQNVESTTGSDHFWKLRCWKSARCCGAKHICKWKKLKTPNTSRSEHFWKLRCWKNARCCGAKHISKSTCTKHTTTFKALLEVEMLKKCALLWREAHLQVKKAKNTKHLTFGALLEVEMLKKCTLLWREAHFQVNMHKTHHDVQSTFGSWDVEKVCAVVARSTFRSQNVKNTTCSDHFWTFRCRFAWQVQGIVDRVKGEQNVRVL